MNLLKALKSLFKKKEPVKKKEPEIVEEIKEDIKPEIESKYKIIKECPGGFHSWIEKDGRIMRKENKYVY